MVYFIFVVFVGGFLLVNLLLAVVVVVYEKEAAQSAVYADMQRELRRRWLQLLLDDKPARELLLDIGNINTATSGQPNPTITQQGHVAGRSKPEGGSSCADNRTSWYSEGAQSGGVQLAASSHSAGEGDGPGGRGLTSLMSRALLARMVEARSPLPRCQVESSNDISAAVATRVYPRDTPRISAAARLVPVSW